MSSIRYAHIKLDPGQHSISHEEFKRQQIDFEAAPVKAKGNGRAGKFNATKVNAPEGRFDSKTEYKRFLELQLLERAGEIADLRTQVRYPLEIDGILVCTYIADFVYRQAGETVVEDSKGFRTREYLQKRRLMKSIHGIVILETGIRSTKKTKNKGARHV